MTKRETFFNMIQSSKYLDEIKNKDLEIHTIDSFQGKEADDMKLVVFDGF
jgi:superfamily I DNA and/or RNA helicase